MPPEEKTQTQTQTQTEEPQDLSDMLVDDAEIEAAEEAAEAQSQQPTSKHTQHLSLIHISEPTRPY